MTENLGRRTGQSERLRTSTPHRLFLSLIAGLAGGQVESLADLLREFNHHNDVTVAYKAFYNRLARPGFATFMHQMFDWQLGSTAAPRVAQASLVVALHRAEFLLLSHEHRRKSSTDACRACDYPTGVASAAALPDDASLRPTQLGFPWIRARGSRAAPKETRAHSFRVKCSGSGGDHAPRRRQLLRSRPLLVPPARRIPLALVLAICAVSTGAPFVRWAAPAPPIAIAALRVAIAAVLLLGMGWRELGSLRRIAPRDRPLVAGSGVLLAIHFGSWIASLSFTSTAASVALVSTSPIFAALFGRLLGDRVSSREVLGIAIAAAGCAVLAGGDWSAGGDGLIGDGLALIGAASAAAYLVIGRRLRAALPLLPYLGTVNAIAAVALIVTAIALGAPLAALPARSYLACAGAALCASVIGHSLLNAAVRTTPTHLVALASLGEPIGSSSITWVAFGEQPPIHAVLGGAIVLGGIAIGFVRRPPGAASPAHTAAVTPASDRAGARRG